MTIAFGNGAWILRCVALFHACLMLPRTGVYAYLDPSGPRAGPMLMLRVFVFAFGVMVAITSVDVGLFTIVAGSGS